MDTRHGMDERTIDAIIEDIMSETHERYVKTQRFVSSRQYVYEHETDEHARTRTDAMEEIIRMAERESVRIRTILALFEDTRLNEDSSLFVWDRAMRQLRHMRTVLRYCEEEAEDRLLCLMEQEHESTAQEEVD